MATGQSSIPVKYGGLGVRCVSSLAISAFLASAASTLSLQADLLSGCASSDDSYFQAYLTLWSTTSGDIPDILPRKQPFWDRPGIRADRFRVECSLSSPFQRPVFLAASSQHSGDWLHALPIAWCGNNTDRQRTDSIGGPFYKRSPKMLQDVTLRVTAFNLRVLSSFPWRPLFFLPVVICQSWPASASACLPFDVDSKPSQASPSHDVFLSLLSCLPSNFTDSTDFTTGPFSISVFCF